LYNMTMALGKRKRSRQRRYNRPTGRGWREPKRKTEQESSRTTHRKEHRMKRGHVTGHKKERKGATDWYKQIEEENIRKIEAEWQAKQQGK
jgi:hypothetical protein